MPKPNGQSKRSQTRQSEDKEYVNGVVRSYMRRRPLRPIHVVHTGTWTAVLSELRAATKTKGKDD